jgi:hypothetical protein
MRQLRFITGDWYQQYHQYFNFNYRNAGLPVEEFFGSWHDGGKESPQARKQPERWLRRQTVGEN